jgi:hypothetical protein
MPQRRAIFKVPAAVGKRRPASQSKTTLLA